MQEKKKNFVSSSFSAALAVAIRESGMSKRAFGERVGISHTSINNYLQGRVPSLDEALKIARFLGLTLDDLIHGKKTQPSADASVWRDRALLAEQRLSSLKDSLGTLLKKI